jgi:DNA-binding Xre family transcriptional regulator
MAISYNRLWKLLIDKEMNKTQLREAAKIGTATLSRLNKNEHVSMEVIEKICSIFNCQASDIMEFIPDRNTNAKEDIHGSEV